MSNADEQEVLSLSVSTLNAYHDFVTGSRMENYAAEKKRLIDMGRGIFTMLAIGTLPVLFMNPGQYFFGLVICFGIAFGLAWALV